MLNESYRWINEKTVYSKDPVDCERRYVVVEPMRNEDTMNQVILNNEKQYGSIEELPIVILSVDDVKMWLVMLDNDDLGQVYTECRRQTSRIWQVAETNSSKHRNVHNFIDGLWNEMNRFNLPV